MTGKRAKLKKPPIRPKKKLLKKSKTNLLLSSLVHDMRAPLNGLFGMITLLKEKINNSEFEQYFTDITTAKQSLSYLIDHILDFAVIEAGKFDLDLQPINLRQLVNDAVSMISYQIDKNKINLFVDYPKDIPCHMLGDAHCISRILVNLLSNAAKFTENGHIKITVRCLKATAKQALIRLQVDDTGIGIPRDKLTFIFKRFSRITNPKKHRREGIGLGLAIVKEITHAMGGTITVKSKLDKGSQFCCTLPFKLLTASQPVSSQQSPLTRLQAYRPKVLLIEDDRVSSHYETTVLTELGCQVDVAESGQQALTMLTNNYDIIFTDIGLPDIDGAELASRIKIQTIAAKQPLIIALTGHMQAEEKKRCLAAGMSGFLSKPVSKEQLLQTLTEWTLATPEVKTAIY